MNKMLLRFFDSLKTDKYLYFYYIGKQIIPNEVWISSEKSRKDNWLF